MIPNTAVGAFAATDVGIERGCKTERRDGESLGE
jgi:hypothetical protein